MLISRKEADSGRRQTHYLPGGCLVIRPVSDPIGWMQGVSLSPGERVQTRLQEFGRICRYA